MLDKAKSGYPHISFHHGDITNLEGKFDLIFSNAALHWIKDHHSLIPSLINRLNPGGVLAVQIPANFNAPSHELLRQAILTQEAWFNCLQDSILFQQFLSAEEYYRLFAKHAVTTTLWTTTYYQVLSGEEPVVEWVKGSIVSELRAKLPESGMAEIMDIYRQLVSAAYPKLNDGTTLFPFTRLFFVVNKTG